MSFVLFFLTLKLIVVTSFSDQSPTKDEEWCGGAIEDTRVSNLLPPAYLSAADHANNFIPFKMLYLIHHSVKPKNKEALEKAAVIVQEKLAKIVKAPRLLDIRLDRSKKGNGCVNPATCGQIDVSPEYTLPCYDVNHVLVPESGVEKKPNADVRKMNEANYSLVIFVAVTEDDANIAKKSAPCRKKTVVAFAGNCQRDRRNFRPTHGYLIFCFSPDELQKVEGRLVDTMLHESLHVVLPDLVGASDPKNQCGNTSGGYDRRAWTKKCHGITWKAVDQPWTDREGIVGTRKRFVSMLDGLATAAKSHYDCPEIEGAEMNFKINLTNNVVEPDFVHWNKRMFSDEILSPSSRPDQRLSIITLSTIDSYSWYRVNLTKAEPLSFSRPQGLKCDIRKSCHDIIRDGKGKNDKSLAPYCDEDSFTPRSMCFDNNRARMECHCSAETDDCPILLTRYPSRTQQSDYDNAYCEKATTMAKIGIHTGGAVGRNTLCITFGYVPYFKEHEKRKLRSVCVKYECYSESILIRLYPENKTVECTMQCKKDDSNTLVKFKMPAACVGRWENERLEIICPNYSEVCKGSYPRSPRGKEPRTMRSFDTEWFSLILTCALSFAV